MVSEVAAVAPQTMEVPMVEAEAVRQMRELAASGWGAKKIARELGLARNTVRRYLRGAAAGVQRHPAQQRLDAEHRKLAAKLFEREAEGNAVWLRSCLRSAASRRASVPCSGRWPAAGARCSQRTWRRSCSRLRPAGRCKSTSATSASGRSGSLERRSPCTSMAAVLSYSRRIFLKAFLHERQGEWLDGIASAFRHFGGVPLEVLGDNTRCLVVGRDRGAQTVTFTPAYVAFCRDWDVHPRACQPYRARTKGKTEAGVKYVKRNAIAGRRFDSFEHLQAHLAEWQLRADHRVHGTTHEVPMARFEREERDALRPLPARPLPTHGRRLLRRVANYAFIDIDTVRYSIPHRLVRDRVDVLVSDADVRVFHGRDLVAVHARSFEPHTHFVDRANFVGLWRKPTESGVSLAQPLAALGRTLDDYAAVIGGAA
jgi:transposase